MHPAFCRREEGGRLFLSFIAIAHYLIRAEAHANIRTGLVCCAFPDSFLPVNTPSLLLILWFIEDLTMAQSNDSPTPSIAVQNLSYKFQDGSAGLENVQLDLPPGSRTLLIGGNSQQAPSY
jgi:hypothetical protein